MSNETTTFILDYAEVHHDFSLGDLFAYLQEKTGIKKSSLSWYLFKLVNEKTCFITLAYVPRPVLTSTFSFTSLNRYQDKEDFLMPVFSCR